MIPSILTSTKKVLGLTEGYTAFDEDVTVAINTAFSTLEQIGIGPEGGFFIEDKTSKWEEYLVPANQLALVRQYVILKTKSLFDPPQTSYGITAMNEQIAQFEWRLNNAAEILLEPYVDPDAPLIDLEEVV